MNYHGLYGLTDQEKRFMEVTENNISYFNDNHKEKLTVEYYVDNGNVARITKNGNTVMDLLSIESAFYAVAAIIRYTEV